MIQQPKRATADVMKRGYFGSKAGAGVFQAIVAQMPPHDLYVETHLGGGAVMLRKPRAAREIGIERDRAALKTFAAYRLPCELRLGMAEDFLSKFDFAKAGRVVVYVDPPYVLATRTSRKRYKFDYTDADHRKLIGLLRALPCNVSVIVSGYPSALYDELLGGWRVLTFQAMTRGGPRTEKLWMNFPGAGPVHGCDFAGAGRTKRQHIKRMAGRWKARYRKLPPAERLAILSALLDLEETQPFAASSAAVAGSRPAAQSKPPALATKATRRPIPAARKSR